MSSRAVESVHRQTAARHGFVEETMGCPIWIGDGEYGFDDVSVGIPHGVYMTHSYMGKKAQDLDALIVVSHFKGHLLGVFGGAIKNVGIGLGSKRGRLCTYLFNHPKFGISTWSIDQEAARAMVKGPKPTAIDQRVDEYPFDAISMNGDLKIDFDKCPGCATCATGLFSGLFRPSLQLFLL